MLPVASWKNLPEMLKLELPTQYHLCDKAIPRAPEIDNRVCVCDRGLTVSGELLFRWSAVKHDWPALVANASEVTSNRFSALKAMRIWLGIEEIDTYAPIYIPPGVNIDVEDSSFDLSDRLNPQELRSASVKIINDFYQHRQANVPWRSRFMRKMRKLRRDPKQFWRDSRPYKRFVK